MHLSGSDPMLEEIELYAADENEYAAALAQQLAAIRQGQNVNEANAAGYTPLMNAVLAGDLKAVDYLLVKGARLHHPGPDNRTAADMAHHEKARELLEACALAERRPNDREREQMRQNLRRAHINPDNLNQALFDAISSWSGSSVMLTAQVLALGANANAINEEGRHILQQRHQDPGTMVLLLRQGSNPNAARDSQGASHAVLNTIHRDPRFVQALLAADAEVSGANALAKAAGKGDSVLVRQFPPPASWHHQCRICPAYPAEIPGDPVPEPGGRHGSGGSAQGQAQLLPPPYGGKMLGPPDDGGIP